MQNSFAAKMLNPMQMGEIICILGPEASRTHVVVIRVGGDTCCLGQSSRMCVRHNLPFYYAFFTSYQFTMYHVSCTMYSFWYTFVYVPYTLGTLGVEQCGLSTPDRFLSPRCQFPHITPPPSLSNTAHYSPSLSNTAHSYPPTGLFAQKLWPGNMEVANCSPPLLCFEFHKGSSSEVKFCILQASCGWEEKELVFCSLSFKDKVALSRVFGIPAFRYIRGKSPPFDFDDIRPDTV